MKKPKYNFYLNPHDHYKWTRCPNCDEKTRVRKFCLVIHCENKAIQFYQLTSINKSCKFCTKCELIICQKTELEKLLSEVLKGKITRVTDDHYLVFGTMEKKDWLKVQKKGLSASQVISLVSQFKDIVDFEITPAGWYRDDD